jgi:tellurite resistance protein
MSKKERLYDGFGELLYVIALADGIIQPEELNELEKIIKLHPEGESINWSFQYEKQKASDPEEVYKKVINTCHNYGPSPVYQEFIQAMEQIAAAAKGIDENEEKQMNSFSQNLTDRFKADLDKAFENR